MGAMKKTIPPPGPISPLAHGPPSAHEAGSLAKDSWEFTTAIGQLIDSAKSAIRIRFWLTENIFPMTGNTFPRMTTK